MKLWNISDMNIYNTSIKCFDNQAKKFLVYVPFPIENQQKHTQRSKIKDRVGMTRTISKPEIWI